MTSFPILYSRTAKGQVQQWQIEVDGGKFRTIEGIQGGALTTSEWTVCKGKNPGKKNETTPEMQAEKEAAAKHQKKIDKGYFVNIDDIDNETFFEPMLAKNWEDCKEDVYKEIEAGNAYDNPKMDGMRLVIGKDYAKSRNGKYVETVVHIQTALEKLCEENPSVRFDGELYSHQFKENFNKIISLARKVKPSEEDLVESAKHLQYWIYGCCFTDKNDPRSKWTYSQRRDWIIKNVGPILKKNSCLVIVESTKIESKEHLNKLFEKHIADGYEGQMIYFDAPYENKRSWNLLKRKEFVTEEFKILDIIEGDGNKTGMAASVAFKTKEGTDFNANVKGSFEFARDLLENKAKYIGEQGTVRFFNYTPDKIPRFPYLVAIRNYE